MEMLTVRQKQAVEIVANGYTLDECADIMHISRSGVEKLLQKAKVKLKAVNLTNAIYIACRTGLIAFCCVAVLNADDTRRSGRGGRRELVMVQSVI